MRRRVRTRRAALALFAGAALLPVSTSLGATSRRPWLIPDPARPYQLYVPQIGIDGPNMQATVSHAGVYQGGTLFVAVNAVGLSGRIRVFGRTYPLERDPGGGLSGLAGFGVLDPPGNTTLTVEVDAFDGSIETRALAVEVVRTQWTVDYIIIPPPDPNAPDPPPPDLPNEQPRLDELYQLVTERRWRRTWIAPVPEPLVVTGYFGEQRSFNGGPVQGHHGGTDFGYVAGTPVASTNDGVVVMAERTLVRGYLVVVDHGGGVLSSYGHMQTLAVTVGQVIPQGHVVGYVGSTGLSTGPHLHWEMAVRGILVDALRWLDGSQGF